MYMYFYVNIIEVPPAEVSSLSSSYNGFLSSLRSLHLFTQATAHGGQAAQPRPVLGIAVGPTGRLGLLVHP